MKLLDVWRGIISKGVRCQENEKLLATLFDNPQPFSGITNEQVSMAKTKASCAIQRIADKEGMTDEEIEMEVLSLIDQVASYLVKGNRRFPVLAKGEGDIDTAAWSLGIISLSGAVPGENGSLSKFSLANREGLVVLRSQLRKRNWAASMIGSGELSIFETAILHHIFREDPDEVNVPRLFLDANKFYLTDTAIYYPSAIPADDTKHDFINVSDELTAFMDSDGELAETRSFAKLDVKRFKRKTEFFEDTQYQIDLPEGQILVSIPGVTITAQKISFDDVKGNRMAGILFNV